MAALGLAPATTDTRAFWGTTELVVGGVSVLATYATLKFGNLSFRLASGVSDSNSGATVDTRTPLVVAVYANISRNVLAETRTPMRLEPEP